MVFTPVFFFDLVRLRRGVTISGRWVVFGSSLAAGPLVVSVLDLLLFFFLFGFGFCDDEGSGLVAAAELEPKRQRETGSKTGMEQHLLLHLPPRRDLPT